MTWREHAKCRGMDPDLFFPGMGDRRGTHRALAVCAACPVRDECLEEGLHERYGVWGGMAPRQRRRLPPGRARPGGVIRHGTDGGHRAHLRRGEEPCRACLVAHALANQMRRAGRVA